MSFHADDPKWTAYVLDELDATERANIEQELAASAEARQFVEELRSTMRLLTAELKSEPALALSAEQRAAIHEQAQPKVTLPEQRSFVRRHWADVAIVTATVLLIAALFLPAMQSARELARQTAAAEQSEIENFEVGEGSVDPSNLSAYSLRDGKPSQLAQDEQINTNENEPFLEAGGGVKSNTAVPMGGKGPLVQPHANEKRIYENNALKSKGHVVDRRQIHGQIVGRPHSESPASQPAPSDAPPPVATEMVTDEYADERGRSSSSEGERQKSLRDLISREVETPFARRTSGDEGDRTGSGQAGAAEELPPVSESESQLTAPEVDLQISTPTEHSHSHTRQQAVVNRITLRPGDIRDIRKEKLAERRAKALEEHLNAERRGKRIERQLGAEAYDQITDNPFYPAKQNPLSTFSIDVDTASYSNIRRFLTQNRVLPPPAAVRIEEMINYFRYDYPQPEGEVPFSVTTEVAGCPWNAGHRLVRVGLKGREIDAKKRPASNLVFLLDVSGSMTDANKLPLVREAMKLLAEQLTENDRVAIVVYAGNSGLVLPSTAGDKQREIREAIDRLEAGGSTNGAGGIQQAYEVASQNFIKGGTNRVILATDGDFNVGITDRDSLIKLITEQAKSGVFLTTLGFGMGNLKDGTLEQLADKGNGNYAYIDDLREAKRVFVEQMQGTLITIAKDVKIQIEFNPAEVASYRLIGYENRILAHEDFNDDKKDAGEIGAGHAVTALYEIAPAAGAAAEEARPAVDQLKYQPQPEAAPVKNDAKPGELLTLKLRYKQPNGETSKLIESVVKDNDQPYARASADFKFASSVALFGMLLRNSPHKGTGTIDGVIELGLEGLSKDDGGYRTEFVELAKLAKQLGAR